MAISARVRECMEESSWIRRMFEEGCALKARCGEENVFDFSLGNPCLEPPPRFQEVLEQVVREKSPGRHAYMPNAGLLETRSAVARYLAQEHRIAFGAEHILMTCGAGGALNVILKALLEPGDEVILLAPFFPEYRFYIDNHGGVAVPVRTKPDFSLDHAALEEKIGKRTKALLLNSPNNPTGKVYDAESLAALGDLLRHQERHGGRPIYLISDEPYAKLVYHGVRVPSIFAAHPHSILATSHSKDLSLPGERIGYLAIHPATPHAQELAAAMTFAQRVLGFVNAPALMQRVVARLQGITIDVGWYQRKRDRLCRALSEMGYSLVWPDGAFYLFPRSPIDDLEFVRELQQSNILTVPGRGFGAPGHFRIAFCVDDCVIEGALPGFAAAISKFR
ncbi:MAG: pyridoxal phosphate-dependent aminotransferase [candidate division NC10 bacterium]|nr:pyridoxal phosphate-dependent aminotransferase [candidate division NC10 bacterium]